MAQRAEQRRLEGMWATCNASPHGKRTGLLRRARPKARAVLPPCCPSERQPSGIHAGDAPGSNRRERIKMKNRLKTGMDCLHGIVRRIWQRVPEVCVTPGHMKLAYFDYAHREGIMVAWPLNHLVGLTWRLNRIWCVYRHQPSWIDRELSRRAIPQGSTLLHHESTCESRGRSVLGSELEARVWEKRYNEQTALCARICAERDQYKERLRILSANAKGEAQPPQ